MILHVDVTLDDICEGVPQRADRCPINIAAERASGVGCRTLRCQLLVGDSDRKANLPQMAIDFIWRFDTHQTNTFAPFAFDVDVPGDAPFASGELPDVMGAPQ